MRALVLLACALLAACGSPEPPPPGTQCTEEARAAITLAVVDGATEDPVCDAVVTLRDGDYVERIEGAEGVNACPYAGAWERPGTYAISVTHPAFETYTREGIDIGADECHVFSFSMTVRLQPVEP